MGSVARHPLVAVLLLGLGGCDIGFPVLGGSTVVVTSTGTGGECEPWGEAPIRPGGPLPAPADAPAACLDPAEPVDVGSRDGVRAWLPGRWFRCEGGLMFDEPHAGVDILADGRWYFLERLGDELVRSKVPGDWNASCGPDVEESMASFNYGVRGWVYSVPFTIEPLTVRLLITKYVAIGDGPLGQAGAGGAGGTAGGAAGAGGIPGAGGAAGRGGAGGSR
jgi:hypothetical protein